MTRPEEDTHTAQQGGDGPEAERLREQACLLVLAGVSFGEMHKLAAGRTVIGRGESATMRLTDDGISREHAAVEVEGNQAILVDLGSTNGTFCNGTRVVRQTLVDGDKIAVGSTTILKFTYQDALDEQFQRQLYESALRDGLTNSFNRRYFVDRLNSELRYSIRHKTPLGLLFIDIDHFKKINDTHGHPAGDAVLAEVAKLLSRSLRAEDVFARYGGEEFAIILRGTGLNGAEILSRRLLGAVSSKPFEHAGKTIPVTVSIGIAVDSSIQEVNGLIAAADAAMYEAKRTGRNRVCVYRPK